MEKMLFNDKEYEIILLKRLIETLDLMLNSEVLELHGNDPHTEVWFQTSIHQKFFYIILLDFLSRSDLELCKEKASCIDSLTIIQEKPNFNDNESISEFNTATEIFKSWINEEVIIKNFYISSLNKEFNLELKREEFIRICGTISKHNFTKLTRISEDIQKILKKNSINISNTSPILLLNDFYEKFHNDILIYHISNISEMLNNIRWGIHHYLLNEFNKSYMKNSSNSYGEYRYIYPKDVKNKFVRVCYWDLMNSIRSKPQFRKFKTTKYLKTRY